MLRYVLSFTILLLSVVPAAAQPAAEPAQPADAPAADQAEPTEDQPAGAAAAVDVADSDGDDGAPTEESAVGEDAEAGDSAQAEGDGAADADPAAAANYDPCDPKAPRPGGQKKKEMPPVPDRTDLAGGNFWMPPASSTNTDAVDGLFFAILALSIFCFVGITVAVVWFTWKYRHRKGHKAEPSSHHSDTLEITWTVIPSIICVIIFILGWRGFLDLNTPPKHALEVQVVAEKWNWTFKYPNGWVDSNLHVPVNQPVRLVMRSKDVLHAFWAPAFRIKQDIIPNRYTKIWFEAKDPGVYRLYCAEYCGTDHSQMKRLVVVHPTAAPPHDEATDGPRDSFQMTYQQYMEEAEQALLDMPPVALGEYLYTNRGCAQCHSVDGSAKTGPTWKGIFGATHQTTAGPVQVDENYLRESIVDPNAKVRSGYNAVMPTFKQLKDEQIDGLITFIKCQK